MSQFSNLEQDELLNLAIESIRKGEHGSAISYLKEGVERFPEDAKLAYILGAEFAQISLYDKAEIEMQRAISLDPSLHTASFQLGLLQMTLGKVPEARQTWTNLDVLPEQHALHLFKSGLESLADGDFVRSRALLEHGIAVNDFSPDLTRDMQNVLSEMPAAQELPAEGQDAAGQGSVWFSAYNTQDDEHKD